MQEAASSALCKNNSYYCLQLTFSSSSFLASWVGHNEVSLFFPKEDILSSQQGTFLQTSSLLRCYVLVDNTILEFFFFEFRQLFKLNFIKSSCVLVHKTNLVFCCSAVNILHCVNKKFPVKEETISLSCNKNSRVWIQ